MNDDHMDSAGRFIGWLAIIAIAGMGTYTISSLYSAVFRMASLSYDDSYIAALAVVFAIVITLFVPESMLSRVVFGIGSLSLIGGVMTALAPSTGLMTTYPLLWGWVGVLSMSLGVGSVFPACWAVSKVLRGQAKVTEDHRRLPKIDRKSSIESKDRRRLSVRRSSKILANPESQSVEDVTKLLETLSVFIDNKQNMAATARALGMSPPGVGDRLRRLYELEPERVTRDAPEWVKRNIKD